VPEARIQGVRERVAAVTEVATFPAVLARILAILQDDTSTAVELAAEIAADQALTLRVLRAVNSGYYGFRRRIGTVPEAVVILGFAEVERLALAVSVMDLFGRSARTRLALRQLWQHSLSCSLAAGVLETRFRSHYPELAGAHVAGLLHDIGRAVIAQSLPEAHPRLLQLIHDEALPPIEAERIVLHGYTHCDVGAWLADRWALPPSLVEAIALHHEPEAPSHYVATVQATHLADAACNALGHGAVPNPATTEPCAAVAERFGYDETLQGAIRERLDRSRGLFTAVTTGAFN